MANSDETVPEGLSRDAVLGVARQFYLIGRESTHTDRGFCCDTPERYNREERQALEQLERAQRTLDGLRRGYAARCGLDNWMPGWFDLDASDYGVALTFVSDHPDEWITHLLEAGVESECVFDLIEEMCEMRGLRCDAQRGAWVPVDPDEVPTLTAKEKGEMATRIMALRRERGLEDS